MSVFELLRTTIDGFRPDPDQRARTIAEGQLAAATGVTLGWQGRAERTDEIALAHRASLAGLIDQYTANGLLGQLDPEIVQAAVDAAGVMLTSDE